MAELNSEKFDDKQDLAEERTEWALQRTLMAKERTFSAWSRTGISTMAIGIAIPRVISEVDPVWLAQALGVTMIITGMMIYILGFFSYKNALQALQEKGIRGRPVWVMATITFAFLFCSVLAIILIT